MGPKMAKAAEASGYFWQNPRINSIGEVKRPDHQYKVGQFYRGGKSIITEEELKACEIIMKAYKKYKNRKKKDYYFITEESLA